ncbi:uncharacterized protein LOC119403553 [Rhipicephalus sanguineus]|uniref:uncharacterized protein LOC119403553 n=1 Tax=Rhipicephalus sanguineus TaxID=34632 RepID=UPI0020C37AE6|nr:uncharacterized protein LOC119403553 [Rhipicephalus sanguineus]
MPKCIAQTPSCLPSRLCLACCFLQLHRHRATYQWIFTTFPRTRDILALSSGIGWRWQPLPSEQRNIIRDHDITDLLLKRLGQGSFSGRGSNAKMLRSNPFLFVVQVMLGMLLSSAGPTLGNLSMDFRHQHTNTGHTWPYHRAPDGVGSQFPANSATSSETMTSRTCYLRDCLGEESFSGRGSNATMLRSSPFLFAIQVRKRFGKCFRSCNVCLVLLPCPHLLLEWFCDLSSSLRFLLLLAGDVDTNPGPRDTVLEEQLKIIAKDIQEMKNEKMVTNQKLAAIDKKLEKIGKMEKQVLECAGRIDKLENMVLSLTKKIDDLDNRGRRSNLFVYGVKELETETHQDLLDAVEKRIFEDKIGIKTAGIERIHRLGRRKTTGSPKNRPVIVKLLDYRDKDNILRYCKKLKGTEYPISEDFSPVVKGIRRKLWERTKEHRDQKDKVFLSYDKVKINNRLYTWDDQSNDILEVAQNGSKDNEQAGRPRNCPRR